MQQAGTNQEECSKSFQSGKYLLLLVVDYLFSSLWNFMSSKFEIGLEKNDINWKVSKGNIREKLDYLCLIVNENILLSINLTERYHCIIYYL